MKHINVNNSIIKFSISKISLLCYLLFFYIHTLFFLQLHHFMYLLLLFLIELFTHMSMYKINLFPINILNSSRNIDEY